jgi:hypothetical protein
MKTVGCRAILDKPVFDGAGEADVAVKFEIDVSLRYADHCRQSGPRLLGGLIVKSVKNQVAFSRNGQSIQTTEEGFGLKRALRFGMTGREIGFAVHVIKHSHRIYQRSLVCVIGAHSNARRSLVNSLAQSETVSSRLGH